MKKTHLIVVGKLKDKHLESIENDYLKRLKNSSLVIHEVKANAENQEFEAREVLKKISDLSKSENPFIVTLTEFGKEYDSPDFSKWLFKRVESNSSVVFIIAGATGHGEEVLKLSNESISLSKLTFPHKIARILFVEQFYRAITIHDGHPYHN